MDQRSALVYWSERCVWTVRCAKIHCNDVLLNGPNTSIAFKHFTASLATFYYIHFCLLEFRQQINYEMRAPASSSEHKQHKEKCAHYFSIFELAFANWIYLFGEIFSSSRRRRWRRRLCARLCSGGRCSTAPVPDTMSGCWIYFVTIRLLILLCVDAVLSFKLFSVQFNTRCGSSWLGNNGLCLPLHNR